MNAIDDNRHYISIECNVALDVVEAILWMTLIHINAMTSNKNDPLIRSALGAAWVHAMVALGKATNTPVANMRRASMLAVEITIKVSKKESHSG